MQSSTLLVVLTCGILLAASCKEKAATTTATIAVAPAKDTLVPATPFQTDTLLIKNKRYVLSVFKGTDSVFFLVEKEQGKAFKAILKDRDYTTNNSDLVFADYNHDGYADIIWTKKWQDHAYLFNPDTENFVEAGEFHHIDTLKVNGQTVYYQGNTPLLYLANEEKDMEWMIQMHSELFAIDSNYRKVSFASIDNFSSLDEDKLEKASKQKNVWITCYTPPYRGRYGNISIWNVGNPVDSFQMKSTAFDKSFISNYWQKHYKGLLPYGKVFTVRRDSPLEYLQ